MQQTKTKRSWFHAQSVVILYLIFLNWPNLHYFYFLSSTVVTKSITTCSRDKKRNHDSALIIEVL